MSTANRVVWYYMVGLPIVNTRSQTGSKVDGCQTNVLHSSQGKGRVRFRFALVDEQENRNGAVVVCMVRFELPDSQAMHYDRQKKVSWVGILGIPRRFPVIQGVQSSESSMARRGQRDRNVDMVPESPRKDRTEVKRSKYGRKMVCKK
jgi:hypothetical protein